MRFTLNRKVAYFVLLVLYKAIDTFDYQSTLLMTPILKDTFGLTKNKISYFTMSYSNVQAFFSAPVAITLSKIFRKLTVIIILIALFICYLAFIFLNNIFEVMLVRYLTSFFLNIVSIVMDIYIQACFAFEERRSIQNNMHLITDICNILIPLIISSFINKVSYNHIYIINLCLVGLMLAFTVCFVQFDAQYLLKATCKQIFASATEIALFSTIMLQFIISLVVQYYDVQIIHFIFLLATLIQTGFLSKTLMVVQLCQACIHAVNQFVIVHAVEKQRLSFFNSLRSGLSLSSALMQPWLQERFSVQKYVIFISILQIGVQLVKIAGVTHQNVLLSAYCAETLPNAMINQYVHNVVFNQRVKQCKTIGFAVQLMQIAASYGTMLASSYLEPIKGIYNVYSYLWLGVIICLYLVEYLFMIVVGDRNITLVAEDSPLERKNLIEAQVTQYTEVEQCKQLGTVQNKQIK